VRAKKSTNVVAWEREREEGTEKGKKCRKGESTLDQRERKEGIYSCKRRNDFDNILLKDEKEAKREGLCERRKRKMLNDGGEN
jgi:hypothetical protein